MKKIFILSGIFLSLLFLPLISYGFFTSEANAPVKSMDFAPKADVKPGLPPQIPINLPGANLQQRETEIQTNSQDSSLINYQGQDSNNGAVQESAVFGQAPSAKINPWAVFGGVAFVLAITFVFLKWRKMI